MIRLTDGTIVNLTETGSNFFKTHLKKEIETGDGDLFIQGHTSKSTGKVSNIEIRLNYDYEQIIKDAIRTVKDKTKFDTTEIPIEVWHEAKAEVLASLAESLIGEHSKDTSSRSARRLFDDVPGVFVGLSTGDVQVRGLISFTETVKEGEKKKVKSRPKTLAKKELLKGTYRQGGAKGSFITLSLREGMFDALVVNGNEITSKEFASPVKETPKTGDAVDCMFVIDTTGSNRSNQPAIRNALGNMLTLLKDVDVKVGFVFQGDYCDGAKVATTYYPRDLENAKEILETNHDTNGGDAPEAYEVGMYEARSVKFREGAKKIIVFVTDAYPHEYNPSSSNSLKKVKRSFIKEYQEARELGSIVHFLYTGGRNTHNMGCKWSQEMAKLSSDSEYMSLHARENIPYVLSGIISAEAGKLEQYEKKAKDLGVYNKEVESALRVFKNRGFSERVIVTGDTGKAHELIGRYSRKKEDPISVFDARKQKRIKDGSVFVELTRKRKLKTPVSIASLDNAGKVWIRNLTDESGSVSIGPDAHSKVYVKVKNEKQKQVKTGESILFIDV